MKYKKILLLIILIVNCQFILAQITEPSEQTKTKFYNKLVTAHISAVNRKGTVKLSNYNNKITVVIFLAAWCKPCIQQALEMKKLQTEFRKNNLKLIGLNADLEIDDKSAFRAMARKYKFNYLIGWTNNKLVESLSELTDFNAIPQILIIYDKQIKGIFVGGSKTTNEKIRESIKTIISEK
jgi:thiol-disulfide isomerase/thioredoxin